MQEPLTSSEASHPQNQANPGANWPPHMHKSLKSSLPKIEMWEKINNPVKHLHRVPEGQGGPHQPISPSPISPSPPRSNPHRPLQISHCRVLPILPCADITSPGTRQTPSPLCAPRGSVPRAQRVASGIPNPWRSRTVPIRFPSHAPSSPPPFPSRSREVPELPRRLLRYCMEQALPPCMHA